LLHWDARRGRSDLPDAVADFLETPIGLAWLHRLVLAAVFVMTLRGPEGIRLVCEFLRLSGLAEVVAASFGAVQKLTRQMQQEVVAFGQQERTRLAVGMAPKAITVCEDETFHPQPCLVAIEPVSNFVLLERYVERRDAQTWNETMAEALAGLRVEVVQSTGDEGQAIKCHARDALQAHHSPDLFHVQHSLSQGVSLPLASRVRRAAEQYDKAVRKTADVLARRDAWHAKRHGPGRPPDFDGRIERAHETEHAARQAIDEALADQQACRDAVAGLSTDYHAYRLDDGMAQSAKQLRVLLEARFAVIDSIADRAGLTERCRKKIDKARRVVDAMVDTVAFVHTEIAVRIAGLEISPAERTEVARRLVPGLYLERVAGRAKQAEERHVLRDTAERLLVPLRAAGHPLRRLAPETAEQVEDVARLCADLFQRSSSCVEGRNGQLALFHHGLHCLTEDKLAALTVVHNFHIRRTDGTTAAQRFFGAGHDDLFGRLVDRMPQLARPARGRSRRPYQPVSKAAA
jgi:hypothetical protein|tara:strand:- start:32 stop:1585 length:1554 start_codon:yes stop_codon:yes gene_type:complete